MGIELSLILNDTHKLVFFNNKRFKVVNAGRGWGKTQEILAEMVKHLEAKYTDQYGVHLPHIIWYIAPTQKQGRLIFWDRLKAFFSQMRPKKNETEMSLKFKNGSQIRVVGSEQHDNLRGPYLTLAIFDEAAFHKQGKWWEKVIRPMLSRVKPLGSAYFYSTPDGENDFYDLFMNGVNPEKKNWTSFHFKTLEGGFIPEEELEEARRDMTLADYLQEYEAEFVASAGRVYYAFDETKNCKQVNHVPGLPIHMFWDFNTYPYCAMGLAHVYQDRVYVFDEICLGNTVTNMEEFIRRYPLDKLADPEKGTLPTISVYGDCNGGNNTSGISDYLMVQNILVESGYSNPEMKVTRSNPWVKDRTNSVNVRLCNAAGQARLFINKAKCPKLYYDLKQVKYAENGDIDKTSDRSITHISDALGYFIFKRWPVLTRESKLAKKIRSKPKDVEPGGYWTKAG